jgi:diguanylate cyclase (GGDEF)-like protein
MPDLPESAQSLETSQKLRLELEKIRSQFYIFYELTKAMRTTLRLDEIVYIILTGLTAHQGLAFNRAILFLVDEKANTINGFMGIGPMDSSEANVIWRHIEQEKMDLYELIKTYNDIKEGGIKPKLMEFVQTLSYPLNKESGLVFDALFEIGSLHLDRQKLARYPGDALVKALQIEDFLVSSLWINNKPGALILVDNCVTKKPISEEDIRIFNMFVDQAALAIQNSKAFEDTLLKAHSDPLTGLWNHGYFQYRLDEEITRSKETQTELTVMMLDLDDFKKFNDSQGHLQGDKALKQIAAILKENCRRIDILCRYGGEEFAVVLPYTKKEESAGLAERVRKAINAAMILDNRFTISIGIASLGRDANDKENLVKKADEAMYKAKAEGKNRVILA